MDANRLVLNIPGHKYDGQPFVPTSINLTTKRNGLVGGVSHGIILAVGPAYELLDTIPAVCLKVQTLENSTEFVCSDCAYYLEIGHPENPDPRWSIATADRFFEQFIGGSVDDGEDGEHEVHFSSSPCDACGNPAGGSRHRFVGLVYV